MTNKAFGPRSVEENASQRWLKSALFLWKRSWTGLIPVAIFSGFLITLLFTKVPVLIAFASFLVASFFWRPCMLFSALQASNGKRVGFYELGKGAVLLFQNKDFMWNEFKKRSVITVVALFGGLCFVLLIRALNDSPPPKEVLDTPWLTMVTFGMNWSAFVCFCWNLNPSGHMAFNQLIALTQGCGYDEASRLNHQAIRKNPDLERLYNRMSSLGLIALMVGVIVPFGVVLVVLGEVLLTCYVVVAYKDVFDQGGIEELETEEVKVTETSAAPSL